MRKSTRVNEFYRFGAVLAALAVFGCGDDVLVDLDGMDMGADVRVEQDTSAGPPVRPGPDSDTRAGEDMGPEDMEPSGPVPNDGWIGGACSGEAECDFEDSTCLSEWPGGTCSQACDRFCPDRDGLNSVSFCIEESGQGQCVARCDNELFPETGCREGYTCRIRQRFNEPGTQQAVCVPEGAENPDATSACLRELDSLGVIWSPWDYQTQYDGGVACTIDDPIRVASPINGIEYRYYSQDTSSTMPMACELAKALVKLGDILADYDIDTVLHIGTFNCRRIGGSNRLSQHGLAMAIDIWGFEDTDGANYVLEQHWEHNTSNPSSPKAQVIYEIGQRMHSEQVFNIVLTPNYNAAHDNHFHVDLTVGGNFVGYSQPDYMITDDRSLCPSPAGLHDH